MIHAKLGDIGEIRANIKITRELAEKYGVSMSTIQRIRNGSLWKESGTVPRP
jgi:predicted transcriptional regulator